MFFASLPSLTMMHLCIDHALHALDAPGFETRISVRVQKEGYMYTINQSNIFYSNKNTHDNNCNKKWIQSELVLI